MDREIKYKIWDRIEKRWYAYEENIYSLAPEIAEINSEYGNDKSRFVWLQFTGLHDKNGKDVYEGDLFEFVSKKDTSIIMLGEVYFKEGCFTMGYGYKNPSGEQRKGYFLSSPMENDGAEWVEVVGNIYENSDLIN